jgi:hypothetical protein
MFYNIDTWPGLTYFQNDEIRRRPGDDAGAADVCGVSDGDQKNVSLSLFRGRFLVGVFTT